jgi:hypothetical protein
MSKVFQQNSLRLLGGVYPDNLTFSHKQTIKTFYGINATDTITLLGLNNTRLNLQVSIKEFYLFNSLCTTYKNITNKTKTKEELSLIFLEIINRVVAYPKFYYTLINYNLPDKIFIKDVILKELLITFNLSLDEIVKDDMIYYELGSWKLKGYSSFVMLFKYINYLDLIVLDSKNQITSCLKNV